MKKQVHFILQGKGGVGKSFISVILAQFFKSQGHKIVCFDTDPVNQTFSRFNDLDVAHLPLLVDGQSKINERNFDPLMEVVLNAADPCHFIIDNGASTFIPLCNYIRENDVIPFLDMNDIDVCVHTIITGGQALKDTLEGLKSILEQLNVNTVSVWLNPFFGDIFIGEKSFIETDFYNKNRDKIKIVINMEQYNPDTFGQDIRSMMSQHLTFDQVQASKHYHIMAKQRIRQMNRAIFSELERKLNPENDDAKKVRK